MITQIEIGGYRLLDEFEADFNPLTVVIGANAVGKSTLINCLQLIAQCSAVPINAAMGEHGGAASLLTVGNEDRRLTWKITFHKSAAAPWNTVPLEQEQSLVYEVVLQADAQSQMYPQYEVLRTREPIEGRYSDPLKFLEATPYRQNIFDRRQGRLIPFDEGQSSPNDVRESDSAKATLKSGLLQPAQQEPALLL